jgi:hypothetical protein
VTAINEFASGSKSGNIGEHLVEALTIPQLQFSEAGRVDQRASPGYK